MNNKYYVYCLMDPTKPGNYSYDGLDFCFLYEPFYIGKGSGNRLNRHSHRDSITKESNLLKKNKILKIINSKKELIKIKIFDNLIESDALKKEEFLINKLGRRDIKSGILCNMSNGGERGERQNQENRKKKIIQYDLSGFKINEFDSLKQASEVMNISKGCISLCCNRKKYTYKGYIWRFKDDLDVSYEIGLSFGNKKIIQIIGNKEVIYNSIKDFCEKNNKKTSNIIDVLKGRRKNNLNIRYY